MKNLLLLTLATITFLSCGDDELTISDLNGSGIWVEKFPEKFEGVQDTLDFRQDQTIGTHPSYGGYGYQFQGSELVIIRPDDMPQITIEVKINSKNEIALIGIPQRFGQGINTTEFIKP